MKKRCINNYYNILVWLEDALSSLVIIVNEHRKHIDEKYWDEYVKASTPPTSAPTEGVL